MIHEYAYDYPGDPELAALIAQEAQARGVPAEAAAHRGLPVHYGTLNPMHYYNPGPGAQARAADLGARHGRGRAEPALR